MSSSARVGILVVGSLGLAYAGFTMLGGALFAVPKSSYIAEFTDAAGIVSGSPVLLSGVNVGSVSSVRLAGAGKAEIKLSLNKDVEIPASSEAVVSTSLVGIGDRSVELIPFVYKDRTGNLEVGGRLPGRVKGPLEGVIPDTTETLKEVNKTLQATQKLIGDEEMRKKVVDLLDNSNKTVAQFGALAARMDSIAGQNQDTLRDTLLQASSIMRDVSVTTSSLAKTVKSGKLEGKTMALLDEMNATVKESKLLIANMNKTVNDPELIGSMKTIVKNTEAMTATGTTIAANAEIMTKNGITLSEKAIEIADKASKLADDISGLLQKVDKAAEKLGGLGGAGAVAGIGKIETSTTLMREASPSRFRTELEMKIPFQTEQYYIGLWDAFESNKITAQIGRNFGKNSEIRYGVYASQLGLGVQYRVAPGIFLRGDVFGVNDPRFDLRTRLDYRGGISAYIGLERIFEKNNPSIGISVKR